MVDTMSAKCRANSRRISRCIAERHARRRKKAGMTAKFNGTAEKVLAYASSAEKKQQTLLQQMGKANLG